MKFNKKIKNKNGFTLVELMIVVAIIAIISTSAIAGYSKYIDKSNATKARAEVATVEIAVNQYNADHPTTQITNSSTLNNYLQSNGALVTGGYLQKQPEFSLSNKYGCSYGMVQETSNGTYHVALNNCSFNNNNAIAMY